MISELPPSPPHDTHAEEAVLGSVLKRPNSMASLSDLQPQDFYSSRYRVIYRAMVDLWERGIAIDYVTLNSRLEAHDLAEARVGLEDLAEINLRVPTASNIDHYAALVRKTACQRRYVDAAQKLSEIAWREGADVDDVARQAEALIAAARPSGSRRDLYDPQRWTEAFWDDLEARSSGQRTAVSTGFADLDRMTLGLEAGGLYLVMATPGSGKTEVALQVAMHVGKTRGPVVFASLEMSAVELAHRYARISHGMDRNRLAKGTLSSDEYATVDQVQKAMLDSRLWPSTPRAQYTTADLRDDALEVQSKAGHVALIVADYVQRFRDRGSKTSSREENIGLVAENLKSLAREFGCPVLAPVQPNRDYVGRANKRPLLSDLRESGKLEQEADVVLGLYRDEKHNEDTHERGVAEVHMLKNRSGVGDSDGMRRLSWNQTRYENYTREATPAWAA